MDSYWFSWMSSSSSSLILHIQFFFSFIFIMFIFIAIIIIIIIKCVSGQNRFSIVVSIVELSMSEFFFSFVFLFFNLAIFMNCSDCCLFGSFFLCFHFVESNRWAKMIYYSENHQIYCCLLCCFFPRTI